jgi:hypothetical protein
VHCGLVWICLLLAAGCCLTPAWIALVTLLQARSVGDEQLTEGLRASVRVMTLQISIAERLRSMLDAAACGSSAAAVLPGTTPHALSSQLQELLSSALDVSELYNAYAQPLELWDIALEICDFAGGLVFRGAVFWRVRG